MKKQTFTILLFLILSAIGQVFAQVDLLSGWDFTNGWVTAGTATIDDNNSFTTSSTGGIYHITLTIGRTYAVRVEGSSTTSIQIRQTVSGELIGADFGYNVFVASNNGIYLYNVGAGTTDITTLELYDLSPADAPTITNHPTNQNILIGQSATFTVTATSTTPLSYQWYINSQTIPGAITATYTTPIINDIAVDGSVLYCVVTNSGGSEPSNSAILNVSFPNERVTNGLQVLYDFKEGSGTQVNDVSGVGSPLNLFINNTSSVAWTNNGLNVNAEVRIKSTQIVSKIFNACTASNEMTFEAWFIPSDTVQNGVYSRIMTLSNDDFHERNFGLMQYGGSYQGQLRTNSTTLNGKAVSTNKNVQELTHYVFTRDINANVKVYVNGVKVAEDQITGDFSTWNDAYYLYLGSDVTNGLFWKGTYYLTAMYSRALSASEVNQNFTFGVESDNFPLLTKQPIGQVLQVGQSATFTVRAIGTAPLTYQWKKNGVNISGANSSTYVTPSLSIGDNNAQYSCLVSSPDGSIESSIAILTILLPDERITQNIIAQYTFKEGSGNTINDVSGVGVPLNLNITTPDAVNWTKNGLEITSSANIFSESAATKIFNSCTASNRFTIEAWIKPANTTQNGPARIVTLSQDASFRNFTLSQNADKYEGRVRTTTTSSNGLPALTSTAGSATTDLQHVVYVFRTDQIAVIFVNGVEKVRATLGGDFSTWSSSFRLALANELLDPRVWLGTLNYIAIFDRSFSSEEVLHNYNMGPYGIGPLNDPTNLDATNSEVGKVNIVWTDNSTNEDGFILERGHGDPIVWQEIASLEANVNSYTDNTVLEGINFSYRCKAFNSFTNTSSNFSNSSSVITLMKNPTALVGRADETGKITLAWNDNSEAETGYSIERGVGDPVAFTIIDSIGPNSINYDDTSVDEGILYSYRVKAFNTLTTSNSSNTMVIRSRASFINTPTDLNAELDPVSGHPILNWVDNAFNELGYVIERRKVTIGTNFIVVDTVGADITTFTDGTVQDSSSYIYRIYGYNDELNSEYSSTVFIDVYVVVGVSEENSLPSEFGLLQNYPNPFNPSTTIAFNLSETAEIKLSVYNLLGQEMLTLLEGNYSAGRHNVLFEASTLPSGIYVYSLTAFGNSGKHFVESKKLVLLK